MHLRRYQNSKYDIIRHPSQVFANIEQDNSSYSLNSDELNNSLERLFSSRMGEIDQYLKEISSLLHRITNKKKEINKDGSSSNTKKLQGLEVMEETLLSAYYTCNDAKTEQRKQISVFDLEDNEESPAEGVMNDSQLYNKINYQLLSDTSLTETKRSLMVDRLTDKWFNMLMDI